MIPVNDSDLYDPVKFYFSDRGDQNDPDNLQDELKTDNQEHTPDQIDSNEQERTLGSMLVAI